MVKTGLLAAREEQVKTAWKHIQASTRVLIATHEHPDGDALGSSLALWHVLRRSGIHATIYIPDAAPDFYSFLPGFNIVTTQKPASAADYDSIILLDYTQLSRTHLTTEFLHHPGSICIDHHYDNPGQARFNFVVPKAAATTQILAEILEIVEEPISQETATCLLTGIFTDTGSFMHDSTTPEILKLASELMGKGARLSHIAHETYQKKNLPSLCIWGRALSRILIQEGSEAAVSLITPEDMKECGAGLDDLAGVVSMLNTLPQTKFAMLLVEYEPGKIKGSLRSEPHKMVDVSKIAKRLGGGGHKLASGFEVEGHIIKQNGTWRIVAPAHPQ